MNGKGKFHRAHWLASWPWRCSSGCGKKDDPVKQAAKKDVAAGVPAPGIAEVKAIAEEGFIYGLPIVMNYAVMNEYAINKDSGQFKAPFNQINNEHRACTPTKTPRSSRPTATRRTRWRGWTCAPSRSCCRCRRSRRTATTR